jgi:hypothetical protein
MTRDPHFCHAWRHTHTGTGEAALWLSRAAGAPGSFDLAEQGRVDDPVPERGDERHVRPAEPAAWLDVDVSAANSVSVR